MPREHVTKTQAADAILQAWIDPGESPRYHEDIKSRLRREWPKLARALDTYEIITYPARQREKAKDDG